VEIFMPPSKELSGAQWVARFPDGGATSALGNDFRPGCEAFIAVMKAGDANVSISSTRRPVERAYLMHFSWQVHKRTLNPQNVPAKAGVNIEWVHRNASGAIDLVASRRAATAMVNGYGIVFRPALASRHTQGRAIDMTISWTGKLNVKKKNGALTTISSTPRSGLNTELRSVGKTYGVTKNPRDPPHWSTDGR
jgi:hypothetical protein